MRRGGGGGGGGVTWAEIVLLASVGEMTRVEIDSDGRFPDLHRSDNVWLGTSP